jgi:hypothetical protein
VPPQHAAFESQVSPVIRQPGPSLHTVIPAPMSSQTREQQVDGPEHGSPSWLHPPDGLMHRPGSPPVALHRKLQQSSGRQQTSPYAWQEYDGTQRASWQFHEQHWMPLAQVSPSVWHVEPPGAGWHVPELSEVPLHTPEQHSPSVEQEAVEAVPSGFTDDVHSRVAHRPPEGDVASG